MDEWATFWLGVGVGVIGFLLCLGIWGLWNPEIQEALSTILSTSLGS